MSKHTPAPWIVTATNAADGANIFAGKVRIGHTVYVPEKGSMEPIISTDEAHANARLIAAAPELLQALIVMVEQAGCYMDDGEASEEEMRAMDAARAAIAKAKGEA